MLIFVIIGVHLLCTFPVLFSVICKVTIIKAIYLIAVREGKVFYFITIIIIIKVGY